MKVKIIQCSKSPFCDWYRSLVGTTYKVEPFDRDCYALTFAEREGQGRAEDWQLLKSDVEILPES